MTKVSFKELVQKMEALTDNQEGKLKGGFASAFQLNTEQSAVLGNNCKCVNKHSSCDTKALSSPYQRS